MRIGRRTFEEVENIPLAPLIDIVFITLVFFMTTYAYSTLEAEMDVKLPTADTAQAGERTRGEIYINIRDDGRIVLNNRVVDLPELQERLYRVAEVFPGGAVIIRGDREAALGQAIAVLNCCKKADIQDVSFAALPEEEPDDAR
jgi:biopolymer transport protein ExbD